MYYMPIRRRGQAYLLTISTYSSSFCVPSTKLQFFLNFELSYSTLQVFFYRLHAKIQLNTNYVGFEVRKRNGRGLVEFLKARNGLTRFSAKFYDKVVGNKDDKDLQHKLKQKKIFFDEIRSKLTHLCSKYKVFFNLKY